MGSGHTIRRVRAEGGLRGHGLLVPVLLLAFGLRAYDLDYGLPWVLHPDERFVVGPALEMARTGSLDPGFYNYPALPMYVPAAVYALGGWTEGASIPAAVLVARWITLLFGLATVVAVYVAGCLWESRRTGWLAALLLALAPFHALDSHYANVDVPMTFWVAAAFAACLAHVRRGERRWVALAAVCCGLAGASKYTALAILPMLAAACFLARAPARKVGRRIALAAGGIALAVATFLAAAPYTVLRFGAVAEALQFERGHVQTGHWGWDLNAGGWNHFPLVYQLTAGLPFVLGLPLYALAICGAAGTVRRPRREVLLLSAALGPLLAVVCTARVVFPRYLMPCLPFLALLAATFLTVRLAGAAGSRALALASLAGTVLYTFALTASLLIALSPQNATLASRWIVGHVREGSSIGVATIVESHSIPRDRYDVRLFDPGDPPEWLVVDSWFATSFERGQWRDSDVHRFLAALGGDASPYERMAVFESTYLSESLYGALDPTFKNQFESPDYAIYRRRGTALPAGEPRRFP